MEVKIKKLVESAVIPSYSTKGDAGLDLTAVSRVFDENGNVVYGTGIAMKIPDGYVGLIFPRSSIAKKDLLLSNSVGVVDSGYVGEIMVKFKPSAAFCEYSNDSESSTSESYETMDFPDRDDQNIYEVGDRVCQLIIMPYPSISFQEVKELEETERGNGSYGSTGN